MIGRRFEYLVLAMIVAASLFFVVDSIAQQASTPGGTIIQTQGYGLYKDDEGREHRTTSDIVRIFLQTVTLLSVTPNETAPSAQVQRHQEFTRLFHICNVGNDAEQVMVSKIEISSPARVVGLSFDLDGNGALSATDLEIHVAETLSPSLGPGACTGVLVLLNSESFPAQTNLVVRLTARSTNAVAANGIQEATGQIVNAVSDGPRITGLDGLAPTLLVNGLLQTVASAHEVLAYSVAMSNSGDGPAQGVVYLDHLPEGLEYVPGTFRVDGELLRDTDPGGGETVSTSVVEATLPSFAPGQLMRLEYQVRVSEGVAPGRGLVNFGIISGQNFAAVKTHDAVVVIDPFGIVFAAHGGALSPIPGASITLLIDTSGTLPLSIAPGVGIPPNIRNLNPVIADAQGRFNFTLGPEQLGSLAAPAVYYLRLTAPGFTNRMLKATLSATHSGLFRATFVAVDGQAIAGANGFDLVRTTVTVEDLASLSRNIPMFETHSLTIDKTVDKQRAEIGDALTYTININNPTPTTIAKLILKDTLPRSFQYAAGTFRILQASAVTGAGWLAPAQQPTMRDNELTMNLGELSPASQVQVQYRVRIGANAHEGEQFNQAFATGQFPDGELVRTDAARVSVYVGAGTFSTRQIILGRVYEDLNRNGRFDNKDRAIAGARVYLMNGQYVLTDIAGLYNFPTVGDGAVVIALDPISIAAGLTLRDEGHVSGRSWARMLRTPLGGGSLLQQDFVLVGGNVSGEIAGAAVALTKAKSAPAAVAPIKSDGTNDDRRKSLAPGTYETAATEKIAPVKPGTALIVSPTSDSAVVSTGSEIQARVAIDWKVLLEINDKPVSDKNIGETRVDHANQVTTYTFAGLTLPPGLNKLRVTPIGPANERGTPVELKVMGRGPVRRIEILTEVKELTSGGKDSLLATIRAWDQWDNPALDGFVAIEGTNVLVMSADSAVRPELFTAQSSSVLPSLDRKGTDFERPLPANARQVNDLRSQMGIALKDGEAQIKLVAPGVATAAHLKVIMLQTVGELDLRIVTEKRPTLLVGLAEAAFGNVPGFGSAETSRDRNRLAFFFRGTIREKNILTLSYDSLRPLNRTAGEDRLFQLDPLERAYPIFGDSSTRFEEAQSNSRLYARLDRGRSYAMFGDFDADLNGLALAGYSRKLTGVKLHLEDRGGSFITLTGARPGTAFARDVIPGGALSLVQLSFSDILAGSENVTLEVRDRRNPEIILSSEVLIRSVDYNLDAITGQLFFLRFISTFDYSLNLTQIVVTYEHRANGFNSMVLTGRAVKKFSGLGLQIGLSGISQRQDKGSAFHLGGLDAIQRLPRAGVLKLAAVWSQGAIDGIGSGASASVAGAGADHNGFAYDIDYNQPVTFLEGVVNGRLAAASAGFLNPFGATITPGSRRGEIAFGFKLRPSSTARLSFVNERNQTERVDNSRSTFSVLWAESISEDLRLNLGYDYRRFSDNHGDGDVASNLFTIGAEWQATKKLQLTAKREQNLGSSDPTYPNQTTIGANYQLNDWAKLFFTQRIASAPIVPIADTTGTGFALSSARNEMAFGVETKLSRFTSMTGRYQIDNGAGTADSFAVIGLVNRFPISKEFSLELGYERGFHLQGEGKNFNSVTLGAGWQPRENFTANVRYELRDRNGLEHLFVIGAAGRVNQSITALSRFQVARTRSGGQQSSFAEGMAAVAIRPATSDRMGLLFSYTRRARELSGTTNLGATRDRLDSLTTDAFFQLTQRLELSGRLAARLNSDQQQQTPVATLTYLTQGRMQYRFAKQFDLAAEMRALIQANSGTAKKSYAGELGFWPLPDLRLGAGYNFALATEPQGNIIGGTRRGFYFNISTKLSNLFNLFGTSRNDMTASGAGKAIEAK
ncbi:MAG: hypothetical protein QOE77_3000 [Blastocatellia bacterium]|jgi:uncharacterized repeat protein (TIGR01451 family)|nr:hypothetical protein [Blastocatellia bacterium]